MTKVRSIRREFILILAASLGLWSALGLFLRNTMVEAAVRNLQSYGERTASELDALLEKPVTILQTLTLDPFPASAQKGLPQVSEKLRSVLAYYKGFTQILVVDGEGGLIMAEPAVVGRQNFSQNRWFLESRRSAKLLWTGITPNLYTNAPEISLVQPLGNGSVAVGVLDLAGLTGNLISQRSSDVLSLGLVDRGGTWLVNKNQDLVNQQILDSEFLARRDAAGTPLLYSTTKDGITRTVFALRLKDVDWYLQVSQDEQEVTAPLVSAFVLLFALLLVFLVFQSVLVVGISSRVWSGLSSLEALARALGEGANIHPQGPQRYREFLWLSGILEDMGDKIRDREETIRRQMAEMEQFTYAASHDLKSPLVTIQGFMGEVRKGLENGDSVRVGKDLERIQRAVDRMGALVTDLLELSRVGKIGAVQEECSLGDLFEEAVEMLAGPLAPIPHKIIRESPLPKVMGEKARLREVWQNLLENAVKYRLIGRTLEIRVGCTRSSRGHYCYLADNGRGIEKEHHKRIFGLYEQLETGSGGTGIGLALVKKIIENNGGTVWVESEGRDQGSRFCFTLGGPLSF